METTLVFDEAAKIRGTFLNFFTTTEKLLDMFLAQYFTGNLTKQNELILLIFGNERITLMSKVEILEYLLKSKAVVFKETNHTIIKDFKSLILMRNILAHSMVLPESSTLDILLFNKHKNIQKSIPISQIDHRDALFNIQKINQLLSDNMNETSIFKKLKQ